MTLACASQLMEMKMLGRQAKTISPETLRRMLAYARATRQPKRDTVVVLLSSRLDCGPAKLPGWNGPW
jgi:hypothetical protein